MGQAVRITAPNGSRLTVTANAPSGCDVVVTGADGETLDRVGIPKGAMVIIDPAGEPDGETTGSADDGHETESDTASGGSGGSGDPADDNGGGLPDDRAPIVDAENAGRRV